MTPILKDLRPAQEGSHLHRYDLSYETADGRIKSYEIVSTNKSLTQHTLGTARTGVMIVAFDKPHEHILLANEFRMGVNQTIINLVSGFIDADESPIKAAERELREETGLQISKILDILPFAFIAPAVTDMTACVVICEAEGTIKSSENPNEVITARWYSKSELRTALYNTATRFSGKAQMLAYLWAYDGTPHIR